MHHPLNQNTRSSNLKLLLLLFVLNFLTIHSQKSLLPQKLNNLEISCPSETHSQKIYGSGNLSKSWIEPPRNSPSCHPRPIIQENKTESRRNIQLMNIDPNPKENPIQISQVLVTTKDKQIIDVTCSHNSITLDKSSAYLFTITTKCLPGSSSDPSADWGLVNVTLHSNITNESVSFYYQKLCGVNYETRFEWGYIILLFISIFLVGIGSRTVTTVIENDELKVIHVFIYVAMFTGCYILLYYWANEVEFTVGIVFSILCLLASAFICNSVLKYFIGQGDCLMIKCKFLCLGKIKFTNMMALLLAGGLIGIWYWKKNWIVNDVLAISLLLALMRIVKVPSMKVGVALLVFVIAAHALWQFVAALLRHPVNGPADSLTGLPLSVNFPKMIPCPTKGTCSAITIIDSIFPGLFISYCYRYDKAKGLKLFYLAGMFGYILGMALHTTFFFTGIITLSPILYIGPCTLLFVFTIAFRRNEHKDIWDGLHSEKEFVEHLLRNIEKDDRRNPQIPEFDSEIFESVDLKKQTERISSYYSGFPTSPSHGTSEFKQLSRNDS